VHAGVIMAAIPAVVALLSSIFLKERINARTWAAVACSSTGIALLTLAKQPPSGSHAAAMDGNTAAQRELWGDVLVFAAVVCEASYAVIGKKLTGVLSARRITALINAWGFTLMTPLGVYAAWHFNFAGVMPSSWLLLVFYALAASIWTVWLWMTGLQHVPAAHAGIFTVMLPIAAALVGVLVLGETMGGLQLVAFAIALAGVVLATLPSGSQAS